LQNLGQLTPRLGQLNTCLGQFFNISGTAGTAQIFSFWENRSIYTQKMVNNQPAANKKNPTAMTKKQPIKKNPTRFFAKIAQVRFPYNYYNA
ncbi:hypothetical protein C3U94_004963, partial [Escherichia coli]|nr:hypothetical protein [Escherichia coli]